MSGCRFWLFGGTDQYSGRGNLSDLWMYDPGTQLWTWINGPNSSANAGTYGTLGVASPSNVPRSRHSGVTWTDAAGHLWLFGGYNDNSGISGCLNDLWMYDIPTNQWTWISGPSTASDLGSYGTQGLAASGNSPMSRVYAVTWTDSAGHFWLYGGNGGNGNVLNDLWMYDPVARLWTWVNGPNTGAIATGTYGTKGLAAAGNTPGSRHGSATWADSSGHLWLFGGTGMDPNSNSADYKDFLSASLPVDSGMLLKGSIGANRQVWLACMSRLCYGHELESRQPVSAVIKFVLGCNYFPHRQVIGAAYIRSPNGSDSSPS